MMLKHSELILNSDGSIYHLNLKPQHVSNNIIFVGDQDRVDKISKYFDSVEFTTQKREFKTTTGIYKGERLTVISTGIGPDNIDIVLNELDALVNIDLDTRTVKSKHTCLNIVRIGTSGSLQTEIPVDSFVMGKYGLGLDGLLHYYSSKHVLEQKIEEAFIEHSHWDIRKSRPYVVKNSQFLENKLSGSKVFKGITATAVGFYGPQGRVLRLPLETPDFNSLINSFSFDGIKVTNLEMETSAIYGLSKLLGHNACSINAIIANRADGTFSKNPYKTVENLIIYTLNKLVK